MSEFKDQWDRMTVVERIAYFRADWAKCRETDDPMVLRIALAVAHDVCRQAADEIERLRSQRVSAAEELAATKAELAACRIAYEQAIRDRDAARLAYCRDVWQGIGDEDEMRQLSPREIAGRQGWPWPIPGAEVAR